MKCPKIDWCPEAHYACNKFNKKKTMYFCHKPENRPFKEVRTKLSYCADGEKK